MLARATADAGGHFACSITAAATTNLHTLVEMSPYLTFAEVQQTVYVPTTGTSTMPAFSMDQYATAKTTGRLNGACTVQSLWFQYSPNGSSGWRNIAHVTTDVYPTGAGYCSFLMGANSAPDGYYRVVHYASPQMFATPGPRTAYAVPPPRCRWPSHPPARHTDPAPSRQAARPSN